MEITSKIVKPEYDYTITLSDKEVVAINKELGRIAGKVQVECPTVFKLWEDLWSVVHENGSL